MHIRRKMRSFTIGDEEDYYGTILLSKDVDTITASLKYEIKSLSFLSLFGCDFTLGRSLEVLVVYSDGSARNFEFHVPAEKASECIENLISQFEVFTMPALKKEEDESEEDEESEDEESEEEESEKKVDEEEEKDEEEH